jgi:hypothetical protein
MIRVGQLEVRARHGRRVILPYWQAAQNGGLASRTLFGMTPKVAIFFNLAKDRCPNRKCHLNSSSAGESELGSGSSGIT